MNFPSNFYLCVERRSPEKNHRFQGENKTSFFCFDLITKSLVSFVPIVDNRKPFPTLFFLSLKIERKRNDWLLFFFFFSSRRIVALKKWIDQILFSLFFPLLDLFNFLFRLIERFLFFYLSIIFNEKKVFTNQNEFFFHSIQEIFFYSKSILNFSRKSSFFDEH